MGVQGNPGLGIDGILWLGKKRNDYMCLLFLCSLTFQKYIFFFSFALFTTLAQQAMGNKMAFFSFNPCLALLVDTTFIPQPYPNPRLRVGAWSQVIAPGQVGLVVGMFICELQLSPSLQAIPEFLHGIHLRGYMQVGNYAVSLPRGCHSRVTQLVVLLFDSRALESSGSGYCLFCAAGVGRVMSSG